MPPNNPMSLWGNEKTMNLNTLVLTNIQSSPYFKVKLFELKTYHEVIDEIYYKVMHLEPWEKGSRKTAGQTGMCGGVRGVGAGGIVSSAYCLLYKLFTLKLTKKQVIGLINHVDSPYIRGLGFMYIRYTQPPADLWPWFEDYLDDDESCFSPRYTNISIALASLRENTHALFLALPIFNRKLLASASGHVNTCGKRCYPKAAQVKIRSGCPNASPPPQLEEIDVKAGGGHVMTIGEMLRQWLVKLEWYSTLFPRIPVPIQKDIAVKLKERPIAYNEPEEPEPQHIPDDQLSFGEAERRRGQQDNSYGSGYRRDGRREDSYRGDGQGSKDFGRDTNYRNGDYSRDRDSYRSSDPGRDRDYRGRSPVNQRSQQQSSYERSSVSRRSPPRYSNSFERELARERDRQQREQGRDRRRSRSRSPRDRGDKRSGSVERRDKRSDSRERKERKSPGRKEKRSGSRERKEKRSGSKERKEKRKSRSAERDYDRRSSHSHKHKKEKKDKHRDEERREGKSHKHKHRDREH